MKKCLRAPGRKREDLSAAPAAAPLGAPRPMLPWLGLRPAFFEWLAGLSRLAVGWNINKFHLAVRQNELAAEVIKRVKQGR